MSKESDEWDRDREMQAALAADGEKLRQLTGQDHGPWPFPPPLTATAAPGVTFPPAAPGQAGTGTLLPSGEYKLGLPAFPPPLPAPLPTGDLETLIRDAFNWGNKMIVITKDHRGLFQTSMKRQDSTSFAVEVDDDVIRSIRGALSILKL